MLRKELKRRKQFKTTTKIGFARMFGSVALASVDTIWALYLSSFNLSDSMVGFISAFLVIITFLFSIRCTSALEKLDEYTVLLTSLSVMAASYLLVSVYKNLVFFLAIFVIVYIADIFRANTFDIIFRDSSRDSELSANEGFLYSIINVGWLTGPLLAGYVTAYLEISAVFAVSAFFMAVCFFFMLTMDIRLPQKTFSGCNAIANLKAFLSRGDFLFIYLIAMGVYVWWALIYIYMPLFIVKSGAGSEFVGVFLAAVMLPLVLFEFEAGRLASRFGFRRFFVAGFLGLAAFALLAFLTNNIYLVMAYLVLASFSIAFVEPLVDAYFFTLLSKEEEEEYFPIFGTYEDMGDIAGKALIALVLLFSPDKAAYLVIAVIMCLLGILSLRVRR